MLSLGYRKRKLSVLIISSFLVGCSLMLLVLAILYFSRISFEQVVSERRGNFISEDYTGKFNWTKLNSYMLEGLDSNQDVCSSFYEYTCGQWSINNPIKNSNIDQDSKKAYGMNDFYYNEFERGIVIFEKKILQTLETLGKNNESIKEYEKSAISYYESCIHSSLVDEKSANIYKILEKFNVNISIYDEEDANINSSFVNEVFVLLADYQSRFRTDLLFKTNVVRIQKDCAKLAVLSIAPIPDWYESAAQKKEASRRLFDISLHQNHGDESKINRTLLEEISSEISGLKRSMKKLYDQNVRLERKIKLNDLLIFLFPKMPWDLYFRRLFPSSSLTMWNKSNPDVIIKGEGYFRNLPALLSGTNRRTFKNYALLQLLRNVEQTVKARTKVRQFRGSQVDPRRQCLDLTLKFFAPAVTRIYFDRIMGQNGTSKWRAEIETMMQAILSAFKLSVAGLDWMDHREKTLLMKKASQLHFQPGLPDWLSDDLYVNEISPSAQVGWNVFENAVKMNQEIFNKHLQPLLFHSRETSGAFLEPDPVLEIDAVYRYMTVSVSMGFILPPIYHMDYPLAVKYGGLGWILAHELMHAFDAQHIEEKPAGLSNGADSMWLSKDTLKTFHDKKHCLVKQYSKFCGGKRAKTCVRGKKTVNDNIADVEGLKIAYLAYKFASQTAMKSRGGKRGNEKRNRSGSNPYNLQQLKTLNVTNDQLFFLTAGRMWCGMGSDFLKQLITTELHAPRQARVDVSMKNFPTFAKAFHCPVGSALAPIRICTIWGDDIESA